MRRAYVIGTCDTKGVELAFVRDCLERAGTRTRLVDVGTRQSPGMADVAPDEVAMAHPDGAAAVFVDDRGQAVAAMADALRRWLPDRDDLAGVVGLGGSGGTALICPALRALDVGVPKLMVSTVASGQVGQYVGGSDITMMYSVTDVAGMNRVSRKVLANAAAAMAGMVKFTSEEQGDDRPALGLTMFGVTTACVDAVRSKMEDRYDCLVFHATGTGGAAMEKLADSDLVDCLIDLTTTEIADLLVGGIFPASDDRLGAPARRPLPYVGSCGALDMVNFGPVSEVPEPYRKRLLYAHNPQVTLMRTTPEENVRIGTFIGERLNRMSGPVCFLLPEGGISALDAPGQPFWDPEADQALFEAIERTVRPGAHHSVLRLPHHINDEQFAQAVVAAFEEIQR